MLVKVLARALAGCVQDAGIAWAWGWESKSVRGNDLRALLGRMKIGKGREGKLKTKARKEGKNWEKEEKGRIP